MRLTGNVVVTVVRSNQDEQAETEDEVVSANEFGVEEGNGRANIYIAFREGYEIQLTVECRAGAILIYDIRCTPTDEDVEASIKEDSLEVHC
jgi:hypothetical protein